ncbi:MAG: hypothetical protein AAF768_01920 [Pseudomonadota bacterium]
MRRAIGVLLCVFVLSGCVMQYKNKYVPIADSNLETGLKAQTRFVTRLIEGSYETRYDEWRGREIPVSLPRLELCLSDGGQINLYGAQAIQDQICGSARGGHFNSETDWESELKSTCYPLASVSHVIETYEGTTFGLYPMTRQTIKCPKR